MKVITFPEKHAEKKNGLNIVLRNMRKNICEDT